MSLPTSSSSRTLTDQAEEDAPVVIKLVAYDLLPPSHLNSVLNFIGAGIYHTAVAIELPVAGRNKGHLPPRELEWAFGGHSQTGQTGVFALPIGTAARRMPGLRFHSTTELGTAFGPEWHKMQAKKRKKEASSPKASTSQLPSTSSYPPAATRSPTEATLAPYGRYPDSRSSSHLTLASESFAYKAMEEIDLTVKGKARADGRGGEKDSEGEEECDDGGVSDGTQHFTRAQRRAYRIVRKMQDDPEWSGTKYKLLGKNCNSFTDELTYRLTGRRAPGWINRAAWFATSLPCLVPEGWIDEADDIVEDAAAPGSQTVAPTPAKPMTATRSPRPQNDF